MRLTKCSGIRFSTDDLTSSLYSLNGATGEASLIGGYGAGEGRDLVTLAVPELSAASLGGMGMLALLPPLSLCLIPEGTYCPSKH